MSFVLKLIIIMIMQLKTKLPYDYSVRFFISKIFFFKENVVLHSKPLNNNELLSELNYLKIRPTFNVLDLDLRCGNSDSFGHIELKLIENQIKSNFNLNQLNIKLIKIIICEESMLAFNTSQAKIVVLGNILNVDMFLLTYNLRNRESSPEERTQWNEFPVNHGLAFEKVFSRNTQEQLRILHEDDVHFTKLVWMPESSTPEASIPSTPTESSTPTSPAELTTSASST